MKLLYKSLLSLSALLLMGACSDKDKWEPGRSEGDTMGVFFKDLESYDKVIEIDDPHTFTVKVDRLDATEAASVPLTVVSCPQGVVVPATVDFAAGETTATFEVDATDMPQKTSGTLSLKIDPAYATLYGAGTSEMSMKITITGGWVLFADDLNMTAYYGRVPDQMIGDMYLLEGTTRFKIPNFLNSGVDMVFTLSDPANDDGERYIIPTTNYAWSDEENDIEDKAWYLYDTAAAQYPSIWTPVGATSDKSLEYLLVFTFDEGEYGSYMIMDSEYMELCTIVFYAGGSGLWEYLMFTYTPKFDPFNQE